MATVRITKDLTYDVINKAEIQFRVRSKAVLDKALAWFEERKEQFAADCYATLLHMNSMTEEQLAMIPSNWLGERSDLRVGKINDVPYSNHFRPVDYPQPIKVPHQMASSWSMVDLNSPLLEPYATMVEQTNRHMLEIKQEQQNMQENLKKLLKNCTTLKQALEIWPHLMEVLPQWAIDKHNEPTVKRGKTTKEELGIDTGALTSVIVKAKMAEAAFRD